ncbi:MAG: (deoxy)nucleoside triphosphate pyrophosphohydrolase [Desulfovibrio sp.]|nr:(deoxy)nucleoside triphosphate pyrophosphohydrolase [Desulfovibrio sp.]
MADETLRRIEVAAGIIWREGRFLAAQRPSDKIQAGWWEFPGGKLEADENAVTALARELQEELGIRVIECAFWQCVEHAYAERGFAARLHFFHVTAFEGEPCPSEGQVVRWVSPDEACELGFLPADADILEELRGLACAPTRQVSAHPA